MALAGLREFATGLLADWRAMTGERRAVRLSRRSRRSSPPALLGLALVVLAVRLLLGRRLSRDAVAVPALFGGVRTSRLAWLRHTPRLLAGLGVPLALLALADPFTALGQQHRLVSRPPHRAHDRRLRQHGVVVQGRLAQHPRRDRGGVLHDGGGGAAFRRNPARRASTRT